MIFQYEINLIFLNGFQVLGRLQRRTKRTSFLNMSLPFVVLLTCVLNALLAAVHLKWLHPWRITLQEVSCLFINLLIPRNQWEHMTNHQEQEAVVYILKQ